jgi:hypothetical protein
MYHLAPFDGCDYKETETHENVTVTVSVCETCGDVDVSWKK